MNCNSEAKLYKKMKRIIFYMGLVLIFYIIFFNALTQWNIPHQLILLIYAILAIFCDRDELLALTIVTIPLSVGFQYRYGILICLIVYFLRFTNKFRYKLTVIPFIFMLLWELLHFDSAFTFGEYFRRFSELLLCVFVIVFVSHKVEYPFIIRILSYCCIVIMTLLLIKSLIDNGFRFNALFNGEYRFGFSDDSDKNFTITFNPNTLGFICNICILAIFQLIESSKVKTIDIIALPILFFFGVLTMSKTFLLCFAVIVIMSLFFRKKNYKRKFIVLGIVVAVLLVTILIISIILPNLLRDFIGRFQVEDISSGRGKLILFYNKHLLSNAKYLLFGLGFQGLKEKLHIIYPDVYDVPHNGIQELLVVWGIPGLLAFIAFIYLMIRTAKKQNKIRFINIAPLLLWFVDIQLGQLITSRTSLLYLTIIYLSLSYDFSSNSDSNDKDAYTEGFIMRKILDIIKHPYKIVVFLNYHGFGWLFTDKFVIKCLYRDRFNEKLNLENPITFNEKLQWLKLYNRNDVYTIMADKYRSKEFVANIVGKEHIVPLIGVWDNPDDIDFDSLPEQFVLKCNHNSGLGMCICTDKSKLNIAEVKRNLKKGLKQNYYLNGREWPYKNIPRKIIAEKYLVDKSGGVLTDYKFFCFDGEPIICYISEDNAEHPTTDFFNMEFKRINLRMKDPNSENPPQKPAHFEEMISMAKKLSKGVPHLRVDFYCVDNTVYVGELTFFHNSGFTQMYPEKWRTKLGDYIQLDKVRIENFNEEQ